LLFGETLAAGCLFGADSDGGEDVVMELPSCKKCENGLLVPLSDYGTEGASVMYKAWVCINPDCGFSIRVDKGQVTFGRKIESPR
jgi:hypothetical protein